LLGRNDQGKGNDRDKPGDTSSHPRHSLAQSN
jgi:hypothetical protein